MRRYVAISFYLILWLGCSAQVAKCASVTDSLERVLAAKRTYGYIDTSTISILQKLYTAYTDADPEKAMRYSHEALSIADMLGDGSRAGLAYTNFGNIYRSQGLYEMAMESFFKVLKFGEESNDSIAMIFSSNDIGNIYYDQKSYDHALQFYKKAYDISLRTTQKDVLMARAVSLNNMALVYRQLRRYNEAYDCFLNALNWRLWIGDSSFIAHSYRYLGQIEELRGHKNESHDFFEKSIGIYSRKKMAVALSDLYQTMAATYAKEGNIGDAICFYNKAAEGFKAEKSNPSLASAYADLSKIYMQLARYSEAEELLNKALSISLDFGYLPVSRDVYAGLADLFQKKGDYKKAIEYFRKGEAIGDSLFNREASRRILSMQFKYQLEKKNKELLDSHHKVEMAEAAMDLASRRSQLLYGLLAAILVIITILAYNYQQKDKLNRRLLAQNQIINHQKAEIEKSNRHLTEAKNQAESLARSKSEFLSRISHELRTPMSGILGFTNLMLQDRSSTENQERLESISYSANKLLHIVNEVLHLSSLEANAVTLEQYPFNLHKMVNELLLNIRAGTTNEAVSIESEINPEVPQMLSGDGTRLYQVLLNLLGNAKKFTREGRICLKVNLLESKGESVRLRFQVIDTGLGIPADKLETIFDSFTQAGDDVHRRFGGTGLGLAITKRIVELAGGTIGVASEPGKGSVFTIEMPFLTTEEEERSTALFTAPQSLEGMNILLAEDNPINQIVLRQQLSRWKVQVAFAENGREAIDILSRENFDLLLLDVQMPEMDGYETAGLIRNPFSCVLNHDMPIIGLTADVFPETRQRALKEGMNDLLIKPFNSEELYKCLSFYRARVQAGA